MSDEISERSLFDLCKATPQETTAATPQSRVVPLTQRGNGVTGSDKQIMSCLVDRLEDRDGYYQGEILYPVLKSLHHKPSLARHLRDVEFRATVNQNGKSGLIYRKLPTGRGRPNSWTESAERAMFASIEQWGQFTADHHFETYRFEPMDNPPELPESFPKLEALFNELLTDSVIDSMDHPVIRRLLGTDSPAEEDDESAY